MSSAATAVPDLLCRRRAIRARRLCTAVSASRRSTAPVSSAGLARVGRESHAEPGLVDALRVVVLIPEDRQHDHRLAVVERLARRVVAAVGDHEVDPGENRGLRQVPFAAHVVVQLDLLGERALWTRSRGARWRRGCRPAAASARRLPSRASRGRDTAGIPRPRAGARVAPTAHPSARSSARCARSRRARASGCSRPRPGSHRGSGRARCP